MKIMKGYLRNVEEMLKCKYAVEITDSDLRELAVTVIQGNKSDLFKIEMDLCESQKQHCVAQIHFALETYHHKGMDTDEIKTIVDNVLTHKAPTPDITDTVRLLLAEQ